MLKQIIMLGSIHFIAGMIIFFVIGLSIRAAMLSNRSSQLVMSLSIVVICFGIELAISFYPTYFPPMFMHDVLLDIAGAIIGTMLADLYLSFRYDRNRKTTLSNSIYERYRNTDKLSYVYDEV